MAEVDGLIEVAGGAVDIVKLGWGTALVSDNLQRQARALPRARDPGRARRDADRGWRSPRTASSRLIDWMRELGLRARRDLRRDDHARAGAQARADRAARQASSPSSPRSAPRTTPARSLPPYRWVEQIEDELAAGAWKVIAEGARGRHRGDLPAQRRGPRGPDRRDRARRRRPSGSCSTRRTSTSRCGSSAASAPRSTSATSPPDDVLSLETLRLGLRSDTLGLTGP